MKKQLYKLTLLALVVLGITALFYYTPLDLEDFSPERIQEFILGFGMFAPVAYLAIYTSRGIVVVIPVLVMSLLSGVVFGVWWGWLLNVLGATLNSCVSFLAARFFGRGFIESIPLLKSGKLKTFDEKAAEHGFKAVLFMRLVPLFQYDAVNFGWGLSKIKFRDYALASFIGMIPGGFITNFLGSSLDNWKSPQFFIAVGAFIALMFVPFIYKKIKNVRPAGPEEL
ncbi:TVP38/TMEM64 family protein [candidate division KSB1 bacterium]